MKNTLIAYSVTAFTAFALLAGCSELKDTLPNPSSGALSVHPDGWATASSASFHGKAIKDQNWDMRGCQTCHGKTYAGGFTGVSCTKCHNQPAGPENCITCHGSVTSAAPPIDLDGRTDRALKTVGAHQIHILGSSLAGPVVCSECHKVPSTVYDAGHVDSQRPAEVTFNNDLTNTKTTGVTPAPSYNASNATCGSTYCHGAFKNGNTTFAPVWNDPSGTQMACGTCHGDVTKTTLAEKALPKTTAEGGTHPVYPKDLTCASCHGDVIDATMKIINPAKHINGKLNLLGAEQSF
ncbi:MAG: CxxxxCH/CxxCH domain-containing protein [Ignavibacteriales bacterium]|nr:CxxxxCH/CxxCH domain-containing protein [Ignavibacteriales bacterium]